MAQMTKALLFLLFIVQINCYTALSQDKPLRIGVRVGTPMSASLNVEYVTRLLDGKLAFTADFMDYSFELGRIISDRYDLTLTQDYWELGINYYIFKEGRSLYVGVAYSEGKSNYFIDNYNFNGRQDGTGSTEYAFSSGIVKVGAKFGRWFYIKPEVGLMLQGFETSHDINIAFGDDTSTVHPLALPWPFSTGIMASIGLGLGF